MLRFQMVVVSSDPALKRQVKRLTLATGAAVEAIPELAAWPADRRADVIILDARHGGLDLSRLPGHARVIFLLPPAPATEHAALLSDRNVTSLIAADEATDEELIACITKALRGEV